MTTRIEELKALAAKATKGPWHIGAGRAGHRFIGDCIQPAVCEVLGDTNRRKANAALIAAAVNALPDLLAVCEAAKDAERFIGFVPFDPKEQDRLFDSRDALRAALKRLEGER